MHNYEAFSIFIQIVFAVTFFVGMVLIPKKIHTIEYYNYEGFIQIWGVGDYGNILYLKFPNLQTLDIMISKPFHYLSVCVVFLWDERKKVVYVLGLLLMFFLYYFIFSLL